MVSDNIWYIYMDKAFSRWEFLCCWRNPRLLAAAVLDWLTSPQRSSGASGWWLLSWSVQIQGQLQVWGGMSCVCLGFSGCFFLKEIRLWNNHKGQRSPAAGYLSRRLTLRKGSSILVNPVTVWLAVHPSGLEERVRGRVDVWLKRRNGPSFWVPWEPRLCWVHSWEAWLVECERGSISVEKMPPGDLARDTEQLLDSGLYIHS